ncbi:MAG: peptide chain release factor 1 [Simkaniaceae bacterium]|nr:peptide chain release factor 1 [Simkaniaceae bacterium]
MGHKERVEALIRRLPEVESLLGDPETARDRKRFRELSREYSYLTELKEKWDALRNAETTLRENRKLLKKESDAEWIAMVREEITKSEEVVAEARSAIEALLVPPDPLDHAGIIMELRAGTGGDEAALFVGDCLRMYHLYADKMKWRYEPLSYTESEAGGYKEYVFSLSGKNVHRLLRYEAGTHRVQRVPVTEAQGRIHTSAVTVAVLIEPGEDEPVDVDESDIKVDTYRASGAGGQHVNTTDSAVRITHLPTGVVVYCQEERSQHKNKAKAMRVLVARLADEKRRSAHRERASLRASQIGSGDRSERIRTYNFPQNRVTDHRIGLTLYRLDRVMQGDLESVTRPLVTYYHRKRVSDA